MPGTPLGVVVEPQQADVRALSDFIMDYLIRNVISSRVSSCFQFLEWPLRMWIARLFPSGEASVPVVIKCKVPEQAVMLEPFELWLPEMHFCLFLDMNLASTGPYVLRARVAATDDLIRHVVERVRSEVAKWDLRGFDPRLSFTEPVHADIGLEFKWPSTSQVHLEVSRFELHLGLPQ